MFGFLYGWRKASKCKKLIKQLQRRLKLLKNKRFSIVRLLREDIEELLKIGHEETALNRADQLFKDENIMAVYELLDNFCEFIRKNMSYIRKSKEIPNDINEAVSSLVFASSRCGELPELRVIRKLFEEWYGQRFAVDTAELFPGNLVNFQIEERLSITSVPDYVKHQLVDEIAKDCGLQPELLALEYTSELQQVLENSVYQELDKDVYTCYSIAEECGRKPSNADKIQDIYVDSLLTSTKATRPNEACSHSHQNSDAVSISFSSSIVQQSSPDASNSPMIDNAKKIENVSQLDSQIGFKGAGDHTKERQMNGRNNTASSSESLPHFDEERLVYLDEIQEFRSSLRKDGDSQDQRLFKFKQCVMPKTETADGCNESSMGQYESLSEKSSLRSSRKSAKASGKLQRRRSLSRESSGMKDIECEIYYEKPYKSPANKHSSHSRRKQQKKSAVEESKQTFYAHKRPIQAFCKDKDEDEKEREFQHCKLQIGTIEKPSLPQKPRRKSYDDKGATEYNIFTYSDRRLKEQIQSNNGKAKASDSLTRCAASEEAVSQTGNKLKPPYLSVKTMPAERTKEKCTDNILRCSSFPCQYPDHVHPKLPNYDDIAAKFMALKKELLQNKC